MATAPTTPVKVNLPGRTQATETEDKVKLRVFIGEFPEYANFLTPSGKTITFYKQHFVTEDNDLAEFALAQAGVKEIKYSADLKIPVPPSRQRSRNWAAADRNYDPTTISAMELLQRAVGNTTHTPQAAESTSTAQ